MDEYVKREAVKEAIGFVYLNCVHYGENKSLLDVINGVPADDVVEVVRCKDCKYNRLTNGSIKAGSYSCNCAWSPCKGRIVEPSFFCFYGEEE